MRCKKHFTDLSSIVGVCASCLRERLFSLVAAQEQARTQSQSQSRSQAQFQSVEEKNRNSDTNLVFPRSVSPYISRRKSDNSAASAVPETWPSEGHHRYGRHHSLPDQRYFSTPQLGPTTTAGGRKKRYSFIRFSLLSNLFRSKKRNEDSSDPRFSVSNSGESCSATSAMSSPSWFSNIRSSGGGGRRTKQRFYCKESSTTTASSGGGVMRKLYCPDRGMSPVRYSDGYAEDEFFDGSSGYESCESRKQTPWRTPAHPSAVRRGGGGNGNGKNVSGLAFCLSPLVRASPNRHWNQKGIPATTVDGGEMRAPAKPPHLSIAKSFCANRSRKLADFGRFNPNR